MQVLVLDEDDDSAATMAILLKRCGHDAYLAANGETALQQAPQHKPDALIVDLGIPGVGGLSVARRFRQIPAFSATPMVAVSRFADEAHRLAAEAAGFDDYLVKPYSVDALAALMARVRARVSASRDRVETTYATARQARQLTRDSRRSLDEYRRQHQLASQQPVPVVAFLGCDASLAELVQAFPMAEQPLTMAFAALDPLTAALDDPFPSRRKCVVVDATAPGIDAGGAIRQLSGRPRPVPVVALVAAHDVRSAVRFMRAGASDVIERSGAEGELLEAVACALENGLSRSPVGQLADHCPAANAITDQERRLLALTVAGTVNKAIAHELGVCLRTVHFRRSALMKKLGARSNADLIRIAVQSGLADYSTS